MSDQEELVPMLQAPVDEAKEIQSVCRAAGVAVVLGRDEHCTTGCAPRVLLLVRRDDAPRMHAVLQERWSSLLDEAEARQGGYAGVGIEADDGGEPPCPACGTRAPLVDGACSECGLALA